MSDITKIKIDNEREHSYKDFPANREFKKRAEDDNPGGSWPSDLPKPSVGGYGYTEQGEQTVITWDGDTSGKEIVSSIPPFQIVKVAEVENHEKFQGANVSINIEGSIIDGIVSNVEETEIESVYRAIVPIEGEGNAVVFIAENSWEFGGENHSAGIYFIYDNGQIFVTSLTYGTPDTIHKIDEKYLPASGNDPDLVFVINKHFDGELSKTDVSIATGTIADFVEKMENENAKCVVRYHNVSEPGNAVTYGEITNVMVERYEAGVYFYYLYACGGYGISVVMIECNTNGTIVNVFKHSYGNES